MEIRCQIIFIKHRFWKIHELETLSTSKRILRKKFGEMFLCQKASSRVLNFPYICLYSELLLKIVRGKKYRQMYGKFKTRLDAFWHSYIPPNFFLKILLLVLKVSNSWIFQKRCFMKIIWHRISIQTLLFQTCLSHQWNLMAIWSLEYIYVHW